MNYISLPKKLYNLSYRLTGNTQLAEKIALKAIENVAKQGISRNDEELFHYAVREILEIALTQYSQHIPGFSERQDTSPELQEILNILPPSERSIVVLRDICGFSSSQVAGFMNIEREVIQKMLAKGRCEVCKLLKQNKVNILT